MTDVCVTRPIFLLQNDDWQEGLVTVFMPQIASDPKLPDTWACDITIEWPGFLCKKRHHGGDAYQALELALRLVPSLISATDEFRNRNLALYNGKVILDSNTIRDFFHARILGDV